MILSSGTGMKTLEVVAALSECPEWHIGKGQVGTVLEELDSGHVLVEFADLDGVAYAIVPMPVGQLIQLKRTPIFPSVWSDA